MYLSVVFIHSSNENSSDTKGGTLLIKPEVCVSTYISCYS